MKTIVVLGAGHAGSQCAVSLRAEGFDGEIVLVNDDEAVPYHKPPLSKKFIVASNPANTPLRAASAYTKADLKWVHQRVSQINTDVQTLQYEDGSTQHFDSLVLATGARNRTLPDVASCRNVFSLRTAKDAMRIHEYQSDVNALTVLGGGFIGLEIAASLNAIGKKVTVIEAADRLLGRVVAPEISTRVQKSLETSGVVVNTASASTTFNIEHQQLLGLEFTDGAVLHTDAMLVGIGAIPNMELAHDAGIACENGIVVNTSLETSVPNIYAIGDCAQFPHWQTGTHQRLESVQNAVDQAKWLAKSIQGKTNEGFRSVPWFWSDIGALKLQIAGIHSGNTTTVARHENEAFALYHLQNGQVVCVETLNSAKDHRLARKLIDQGIQVSESDIQKGPEALKALLS